MESSKNITWQPIYELAHSNFSKRYQYCWHSTSPDKNSGRQSALFHLLNWATSGKAGKRRSAIQDDLGSTRMKVRLLKMVRGKKLQKWFDQSLANKTRNNSCKRRNSGEPYLHHYLSVSFQHLSIASGLKLPKSYARGQHNSYFLSALLLGFNSYLRSCAADP